MWVFLGIVIALILAEVVLSLTLKKVYEKWERPSFGFLLWRNPPPPLGAYLYAPKAAHGRLILPSAPLGLLYWHLDWKRWRKEENKRQERRARELPDLIPLAKNVIAKHGTNAESRRSPEALAECLYDFSEEFPWKSARERLENMLARDDLEPLYVKDVRERAAKLGGVSMQEVYERDRQLLRESPFPSPECLSHGELDLHCKGSPLPADRLEHLSTCLYCQGLAAMQP